MMSIKIAIILLLVAAPCAAGYGTLAQGNDAGTTLREQADTQLRFWLYGFYGHPELAGHHYKVGYADDDRTWFVYLDEDSDYRHDAHEWRSESVSLPATTLHGNATDHVLVMMPDDHRLRVCTSDAQDGLADGLGRGLRCNGDVDDDGVGDTEEISRGENPFSTGNDAISDPMLP